MSVVCSDVQRRSFHHDPYATRLLAGRSERSNRNSTSLSSTNSGSGSGSCSRAALDFFNAVSYMDDSQSTPPPKIFERADSHDHMTATEGEGGMSDNGTDDASRTLSAYPQAAAVAAVVPPSAPPAVRYASVDFRFGSAWFVAPFRTAVGEMVVVEYPHNGSLHVGLVSCISTRVPPTFAALLASDGGARAGELEQCPRLLRHARDFDKATKLELRTHDLASLKAASELAAEMQAPVTFLDAEWLLDLTAVTFLVNVWGDMTLVDRLADELATREGAEVVFTYPALN
ncbi:hypothetical protein DQ04_07591000 [Trypanosoma grayi]|uniref:hypothetical protein n=1 Tax=Trypanosoma grayi TaxID=71804 RepID=UPI0004F4006C|nr:hypothetical protein DQ04_07591000 [Trypanosoma grayi]KEG08263.1 hypothetical protein DQ04_07591000 [Trypanosoma grayi]